MTIADIVARAKGTSHAWRVTRDTYHPLGGGTVEVASLHHYSTEMLRWRVDDPTDADWLWHGTGWGSVSDANGMNTAFGVLRLNLRFCRDKRGGGPRVEAAEYSPWVHCRATEQRRRWGIVVEEARTVPPSDCHDGFTWITESYTYCPA